MPRFNPARATVMFALLAAARSAVAQGPCPGDWQPVAQFTAGLVTQYNLPGCALRITQEGDLLFEQPFGGYTLDQVVPSASAAKWMSATVVMALVDRGLLALDDTTGQWLGWMGEKGIITIRQLFSHTSGIQPEESACLSQPNTTLEACVAEIYQLPLIGPPGAQFAYGGNSMQVAGRICEVAAGRPFVELFDEYVRTPLAFAQTVYTSNTNPRVAGGMRTALRDYSRLVEMYLAGGELNHVRVLTPESVAEALRDQTNGAPYQSLPPCLPTYHGYGIGNWLWPVGGAGPQGNSSPGAFKLTPWIDRSRSASVAFVTTTLNQGLCDALPMLQALIEQTLDFHRRGDLNCDQRTDFDDISPFVLALGDPAGYAQAYPACFRMNADTNCDGAVNFTDINGFVALLSR